MRTLATSLAGCFLLVTMSMQQWQVVSRILPSLDFGKDMIDFHLVSIHEVPLAFPALRLLVLQEPGDARGDVWMTSYAIAPVDPVAVIWTACALDFHVSLDGGMCVAGEASPTVWWLAGPALPIVHSPVSASDPVLLLVWVTEDCPSPQHRVDRVGKGLQDPGTGNVRVVVAPANTLGVERLHQPLLRCVLMVVNRLAQFCHMSADRRVAGCDARFETLQASSAIFPSMGFPRWVGLHMQATEVESRGCLRFYAGVGDACLAWLQSPSHVLPPLCRHVLTWPNDLAILVEDHTVISIDHDFGCLQASTPTPWKPLAQDRLSTVQGTGGNERCTGASLHGPFFRGEPLAGSIPPRLQPSFHLAAAAAGARVDLVEDGCLINLVEAF